MANYLATPASKTTLIFKIQFPEKQLEIGFKLEMFTRISRYRWT
jgi:hypothetical protein